MAKSASTLPKIEPNQDATLDTLPHRQKLWQLHLHSRLEQLEDDERQDLIDLIGVEDHGLDPEEYALIHGLDEIDEEAVTPEEVEAHEQRITSSQKLLGQFDGLMTLYSLLPDDKILKADYRDEIVTDGDETGLHDILDTDAELAFFDTVSAENRHEGIDEKDSFERILLQTEILVVGYFIELARINGKVSDVLKGGMSVDERLESIGYQTPGSVEKIMKFMEKKGVVFNLGGPAGIGKTHMLHSLFVRCEEILMELIGTKDAKAIMKYIWSESTIFDARKLDVDNLPTIEPGTIVVMDDLFAEYQSLVDGSNKPSEDELSKLREFIMSVHETPGVMCLITTNYTQNEISEALKSSSADTGNRAASRATSLVRPWIASADTPNRRDIEGAALEDLFE